MSVRRKFKHPFLDTKAWKRLLHTEKTCGNLLNLGTARLRLLKYLAPTFALAPSTSSSLFATSKSSGAGELLPMLTPCPDQSPSSRAPAMVVLACNMSWNLCSCLLISASIISAILSSSVGGIVIGSPSPLDIVAPGQRTTL